MLQRFSIKYLLYLFRWQLSTPLLAFVLFFLGDNIIAVVIANLIGGLVFFWIDRKILEEKQEKIVKKYLMYFGRWQLTSITLYPVVQLFGPGLVGILLANLIGGLIFFWVDRWIFTGKIFPPLWEVSKDVICVDCKKRVVRGYRLVIALNYNKRKEESPEFRCESCSIKKTKELRERGLQV